MYSSKSFTKIKTFLEVIKAHLFIFKSRYVGDLIDTSIWVVVITLVTAYIFPQMGMSAGFGAFFLVGNITSAIFFDVYDNTATFWADLENDKEITYLFTLPMPAWMVFISKGVFYAIKSALVAIIVLPIGKLLLWNNFDLSNFSTFKFLLIYLLINLFNGFFCVLIPTLINGLDDLKVLWVRILFPIWFFGGSQYSLKTLESLSPIFAKISLFNPYLYAYEGIRAAVFGQKDYLSFWVCVIVLLTSTFFAGWLGIKRLKKRLDFI